MGRSARSLDEAEPWTLSDGVATVLGLIARNPTLVGGSTAFLVALSFVSANALWYQPYAHSGAFFATRDFVRPGAPQQPEETTILIERPQPTPVIEGDPMVKKVQRTLRDLNFYGGDVDGLYGPNTREAIASYQTKMGLAVTGAVDDTLLDQLGTGSVKQVSLKQVSGKPVALPEPAPREVVATAATPPVRDDRIAKVQGGLQEFGNEAIEADGLMGAKTEAAIREFQSLFGLTVTGRADQEVYAKMKEIGLIK